MLANCWLNINQLVVDYQPASECLNAERHPSFAERDGGGPGTMAMGSGLRPGPALAKAFPTAAAVNEALRAALEMAAAVSSSKRRRDGTLQRARSRGTNQRRRRAARR